MKRAEELSGDELLEELGVELDAPKPGALSARQERILAGFEDIVRFVEKHRSAPKHGENLDIFERLYAVRLDRIRMLPPDELEILRPLDKWNLLDGVQATSALPIGDDLLSELDQHDEDGTDIGVLRYVRGAQEHDSPEEVADRVLCQDFDLFRTLFKEVEADLAAGRREARKFEKDASVIAGDFFILRGELVYVATVGDDFLLPSGHTDARLRAIYSNGTESNLLRRSLQRALYRDEHGRRITQMDLGPLFGSHIEPEDLVSGTVYVLRSLSELPAVAAVRDVLHKIGITGGRVQDRIKDAENDATYLLAPVQIVAEWKIANISRFKMEQTFHRLFSPARLQIEIQDRFGKLVQPREWFVVPLPVIDEAVQRIRDGSITRFVYDPSSARLKEA